MADIFNHTAAMGDGELGEYYDDEDLNFPDDDDVIIGDEEEEEDNHHHHTLDDEDKSVIDIDHSIPSIGSMHHLDEDTDQCTEDIRDVEESNTVTVRPTGLPPLIVPLVGSHPISVNKGTVTRAKELNARGVFILPPSDVLLQSVDCGVAYANIYRQHYLHTAGTWPHFLMYMTTLTDTDREAQMTGLIDSAVDMHLYNGNESAVGCEAQWKASRAHLDPQYDSTGLYNCGRCGSDRVAVARRQIRRGDEGESEIRRCVDCGWKTFRA
jgi:DNA-directed RNA polymerase subunit M/transcription elongation factor TFIIS